MQESIDKLIFTIEELNRKLLTNVKQMNEVNACINSCTKEFVAGVEKILELKNAMTSKMTTSTKSDEEKFSIDTAVGLLGFAGVTFPDIMDELVETISSLASGGISIPNLLLHFGNVLIGTPVGVMIGNSILEEVENWISKNFSQGVVNAIGAALSLIAFTGLGWSIGGPVGAAIGFLISSYGNGKYFEKEIAQLGNVIMENVFNFDLQTSLWETAKENFAEVDEANGFFEIGVNIVEGIIAGILSAMALLAEPWIDLFTWVSEGICKVFGINSPAKAMIPFGENILLGIVQGFVGAFDTWSEVFHTFWNEAIAPWFGLDLWAGFGENIKNGLSEKWTEFKGWWTESGLYTWWEVDVAPWFTKERWTGFGDNIRSGLSEKWVEFTEWWKNIGLYSWWNESVTPWFDKERWTWSGIKEGLEHAFKDAIDSVKQIWNRFAGWLNDKLAISWNSFSIGDYEIIPAGSYKLGEIPTFYTGGFPEKSSLFFAGEYGVPELLGTVGGKTAVASGTEITGIATAVYSTGQEEALLLKSAINLLQEIANKDMSVNIGDREIARANYRGQKSLGSRLITSY